MSTLIKWNATLGVHQNFAPAADTAEIRTIDTDIGIALNIGQTLATAINIGKNGVNTGIAGGLTLTNSGLTMTGLNIGSAAGEIGEVFIASDKYIYFGDGQEGSLGFDSAPAPKMIANAISWDFGSCAPLNVPSGVNFAIGGTALTTANWTKAAADIVFGNGTGNADPYHTHTAAELTQTFTNGQLDQLVAGTLVYQADGIVQTALRASAADVTNHAWRVVGIVKTSTNAGLPTPVYTYPGTTNLVLVSGADAAWAIADNGKPAYLAAVGQEGKATKTLPVANVIMQVGIIVDGANAVILYQPAYRGAL